MLKKSVFEKFVKEMKAKFKDEYILILATDISGEWELQQVEAYGGTYGLTLGSHRVDTLDDNHINEFEKPHNQIIRKYNLPEEVTDYILYMVEQLDAMQNELEEAKEEIESLQNEVDSEWELKQMEYDDLDRGCYDDDFYDED